MVYPNKCFLSGFAKFPFFFPMHHSVLQGSVSVPQSFPFVSLGSHSLPHNSFSISFYIARVSSFYCHVPFPYRRVPIWYCKFLFLHRKFPFLHRKVPFPYRNVPFLHHKVPFLFSYSTGPFLYHKVPFLYVCLSVSRFPSCIGRVAL